ncbi:hypothetical protein [Alicyclobacillus acidoterrestris]|uniref:Uncharacterized protein n=1 Tax=Alicyclobacillus acidoterrestris (strain ATCC 49025 / DSM 3922 / CIP 106132 / NCIMB 13137 / GD3B) TaxID=1356854 RepID=T0DDE1_ALIAG|nr:hypothetical protein [Alicyclobacillus acidoterrestris]EPZ47676.1 hypothetical protein N007_05320 [Alicyclobacillus acidoterrestris ATCC 49025]UNO48006.1 hypothetical protein K1I37_15130 [Alicyclobacillus acidoterrestris]
MYKPQLGETVWFVFRLDDDYEIKLYGTVTVKNLIDKFNRYYEYGISTDDGEYYVTSEMIYRTRAELLRRDLKQAMDNLDNIESTIAYLESELTNE